MAARKRRSPKGEQARANILDAAESCFAAKGFYGAGVREIAGKLDMPTASLLHHFPSKEKLYGAVLARIADRVDGQASAALATDGPRWVALRALFERMLDWALKRPTETTLLLRELLDNPARIDAAPRLHMAPFVQRVSAAVRGGQATGELAADMDPDLVVIQFSGALSYYVAARPTLRRIFDSRKTADLDRAFRADAIAMFERALTGAPR